MGRWAMVHKTAGFVASVIEWDGDTAKYVPPEGYEMIEDTEFAASSGFTYVDGTFVPPPVGTAPEEPPTGG
jgi:hypothetical protein